MTQTYTASVPRPIPAFDQTAMGLALRSSVGLAINIARCRARILGANAAGFEIDLCLRDLANAKKQGNDAD